MAWLMPWQKYWIFGISTPTGYRSNFLLLPWISSRGGWGFSQPSEGHLLMTGLLLQGTGLWGLCAAWTWAAGAPGAQASSDWINGPRTASGQSWLFICKLKIRSRHSTAALGGRANLLACCSPGAIISQGPECTASPEDEHCSIAVPSLSRAPKHGSTPRVQGWLI